MRQYLIQFKWWRNLFPRQIYFISDGIWYRIQDYKKGQKLENTCNSNTTHAWCKCGNELVHSNSFESTITYKNSNVVVFVYVCSYCDTQQYWNPDVIPGLIQCNVTGVPLIDEMKKMEENE